MKKTLLKTLPHLMLTSLLILCFYSIEGIVSLTIKNLFDFTLEGNMDAFKSSTVKLIILSVILLPTGLLLSYARSSYTRKSVLSLKCNFIRGIFSKNINEFDKDSTGEYISSITNDINTIERCYVGGLLTAAESTIQILIGVALITYVSIWALVGCFVVCLFSAFLTHIFNGPIQSQQIQRSKLFGKYTSYIKEVMSAFHIIKTNSLHDKVYGDYEVRCKEVQDRSYTLDKLYTYIISLENAAFMLSFIVLFFITGLVAFKGGLSTGSVFLVVITYEKIMNPTMTLASVIPEMLSTKKIFSKLDGLLKNSQNNIEDFNMKDFKNHIKLLGVEFTYDSDSILKDINLSIKKGEKCLLVGPSGGGKSTLLKLLRKYFPPSSGSITVDGVDLNHITNESYFKNITNIDQNIFLFEDTIKNNITMYKDFTQEEICDAVERAGLTDFIEKLSLGLETVVKDNGANLSGGEKSRIAIARSLLSKSSIILMDEAFSSLDYNTARKIERTLLNLPGITLLNVSHVIFSENKDSYDRIYMVREKMVQEI